MHHPSVHERQSDRGVRLFDRIRANLAARNALRLGKILNIEIGLDYSWFIVFALVTWTLSANYFPDIYHAWPRLYPPLGEGIYWLVGLTTSLLFFASVLAHELGHSVVAIRTGLPVQSITLFIFGGVARIVREPTRPSQEFLIAIAGPAVSALLGLFFWALSTSLSNPRAPLAALAEWLSYTNLALAVFNLIPGFPLDGGRVLRAILWSIGGDLIRATRIASWIGRGVAYLFILAGLLLALFDGDWLSGVWLAFIGWFLDNAASMSYQQLALREMLNSRAAREMLQSDLPQVPRDLTLDRFIQEYILTTGRRSFPVIDDGRPLGIITLHHVKAILKDSWATTTVEAVMTRLESTIQVNPDDTLARVLEQMTVDGVNQVLVIQDGRLLGLISREQLFSFIQMRAELGM